MSDELKQRLKRESVVNEPITVANAIVDLLSGDANGEVIHIGRYFNLTRLDRNGSLFAYCFYNPPHGYQFTFDLASIRSYHSLLQTENSLENTPNRVGHNLICPYLLDVSYITIIYSYHEITPLPSCI